MNRNSLKYSLVEGRSHMTPHYTWGSVTTLHEFGGVLGQPLDTFFWALKISWSRLLVCVWSGPKECTKIWSWSDIQPQLTPCARILGQSTLATSRLFSHFFHQFLLFPYVFLLLVAQILRNDAYHGQIGEIKPTLTRNPNFKWIHYAQLLILGSLIFTQSYWNHLRNIYSKE